MRSRVLAQTLNQRELHFLDAPVSGGVKGAGNGSLTIMVGGDEGQFDRYYDVLKGMGRAITHVGGPGAGHALKALNNYVSAAGIIATIEALHVGQEFGLDPAVMTDIFNSSTGQNYATTNKVKQYMLSGTFNSGFALQLMTKDLGTAINLGDLLGWSMRLGHEVLQVWLEAAEELKRSADHTEMYRYLQRKIEADL
jgi:3-hydroxyisobutyrate dehydrogenase